MIRWCNILSAFYLNLYNPSLSAQIHILKRFIKCRTKERAELRSIDAKINNGVVAILSGVKIPELEAELDRLRIRKSELEDIISRRTLNTQKVDPAAIVKLFQTAIENWNEETLPLIIKQHITKIYAHTDGTYSVNVGVHINGARVDNGFENITRMGSRHTYSKENRHIGVFIYNCLQ